MKNNVNKQELFARTPVPQALLTMAVPTIISQMINLIYNMVDAFFIGRTGNSYMMAATTITLTLVMMNVALSNLFGIGGASSFNIAMGEDSRDKAVHYMGNAAAMLFCCGLALCFLTQTFLDPLLRFFGSPDDVLAYAKTYTRITSLGFPFLVLTTGGGHLIRADGRPRVTMLCNMSGAVVNTILDALFVFGFHWGMAGAAALCASSALRSGAGLVTVACPASILPIVQTLAPCAMAIPLPEADGAIGPEAVAVLKPALAGKHALACGCGLSRRAAPAVLKLLLESGIPALFDADGLNLIAANDALKALLRPHHLITPHPGEAARLLGRPIADPLADALALAGLGCQALLKGATTVIPVGGVPWLSASGCAGMAKGGSGDVLTGLTVSLMAQCAASGASLAGVALAKCAAMASEIHGRAGELAQQRVGVRGMCASDIVDALPQALLGYA